MKGAGYRAMPCGDLVTIIHTTTARCPKTKRQKVYNSELTVDQAAIFIGSLSQALTAAQKVREQAKKEPLSWAR